MRFSAIVPLMVQTRVPGSFLVPGDRLWVAFQSVFTDLRLHFDSLRCDDNWRGNSSLLVNRGAVPGAGRYGFAREINRRSTIHIGLNCPLDHFTDEIADACGLKFVTAPKLKRITNAA